jgi:hypothetical protein
MEMYTMISLSASFLNPPEVRIHGGTTLSALATEIGDVSWLELKNEHNDRIVVFLPYSFAQDLAAAINTINTSRARRNAFAISEPSDAT